MFTNFSNKFKKLNVPTKQDKKYLLKYRTYSDECVEAILSLKSDNNKFNIYQNKNIDDNKNIISCNNNFEDNRNKIEDNSNKIKDNSNKIEDKSNKNDLLDKYIKKNKKHKVEESSDKKPFNYRTLLCKFFLVNACTKGDDCGYSHDTSQFPCKAHFVRQSCKRKNCLFSHDPNTLDKLDECLEDNNLSKVDSPFF
ncbi:zinc finger C3H domain-containing protein [Vairimorpha necatrix]|uniref:Zinc finger C3H domain-containing protein n=1 Tax=Vairimorpha necatrix TaxID=6039 RepID=A0AAX4J9W1_9MICR